MWEFWRGRNKPARHSSSGVSARGDGDFVGGAAGGLGSTGSGPTAFGAGGGDGPYTGRTPASTPHAGGSQPRRSLPVVNFKDLNLSVDGELEDEDWEGGEDGGFEDVDDADDDPTNKRSIIARSSSRGGVPRPRLRPGAAAAAAAAAADPSSAAAAAAAAAAGTPPLPPLPAGPQRNKLIVIMVGLPGRGKTFLCNKLRCYLSWLGHNTAHFNVGAYRRMQRGEGGEPQDAAFFDAHNPAGVEARNRALDAALADLMAYLESEHGQVGIFDATNSTVERRKKLIDTFHGKFQYLFIESICNDEAVLEANYRAKMRYSPDYAGLDPEAALADFKSRIAKYLDVYEPIGDRRLHYIKVVDMVTGRGYMDVNRISGYIPGKIAFFLMQVCKAGMTAGQARRIWLTRHGESVFNTLGRIGGDSGLSPRGQQYAQMLPAVLESRLPTTDELVSAAAAAAAATSGGDAAAAAAAAEAAAEAARRAAEEGGPPPVPLSVWTSTLRRTILTAKFLPYPKLRWKALDEIHAGTMDSMTYEEIAERHPEDAKARRKDKLRYRYPAGESYLDVVQRLEPVIAEIEREKECVLVVAHQAVLRAVLAYFLGVPLRDLPRIEVPLHTLVELRPRPDGTVGVTRIPVPLPIDGVLTLASHGSASVGGSGGGGASGSAGGTGGGGGGGASSSQGGAGVAAAGGAAAAAIAAAAAVGSGTGSAADSGDGDGAAAPLLVGGRGAAAALGVGGVTGGGGALLAGRLPSLSAMLPAPKGLPLGSSPSGSPATAGPDGAAVGGEEAPRALQTSGASLTFPALLNSGKGPATVAAPLAPVGNAPPPPPPELVAAGTGLPPPIETGRPRRYSDASGLHGALSSPTAGAGGAGSSSPFAGAGGAEAAATAAAAGGPLLPPPSPAAAAATPEAAAAALDSADHAAAALATLALGGSPTQTKGKPLSGV